MMNQILVLITDDDEDDRLFLRTAIERHIKEAVIYEAHNGNDALAWLERQDKTFNLILLDVNMPGMSGIEVLDKIRSKPNLRNTPTVILSTSDDRRQIEEAYQKGVNSYIKKPNAYSEYDEIAKAIKTCFLNVL